jgi:protocatechuate 3,4-dioxygenase beta subunit
MRSATLAAAALAAVAIAGAWYLRCRGTPEDPPPAAGSGARARLLDLRHQQPGSIAGKVTATAVAVGDATVCARAHDGATRCTATDATGAYTIGELAPGGYLVWASAPGFGGGRWLGSGAGDGSLWVASERRSAGVDIELVAGTAEVHGTVHDVRGHAIAGALVHVGPDAHSPPAFTTQTAVDGAFVAWAKPGDIYVAVSAEHFVDGDAHAMAPADAIAIALEPESVLAGLIVEAGTRRPLGDAAVSAGGNTVRSDAGGRFRIAKLAPGRYKPTASTIGGYGETAESVLVELGRAREDLVIEIHPVAVVAGKVVVDDGTTVRACPPDRGDVSLNRYGSRAFYHARTMDGGDILLEGVVPGTYEVAVACAGYLARVPYPDLVVGNSDVEDVVWRVSPGARIAGHVRSRAGAPIAHAIINHVASGGGSFGSTTTGADGAFVAEGVAPGISELTVYADGFPRDGTKQQVTAALDRVATIDFTLDPGGAIEGDVVDTAGKPVAVVVEASGGGSTWADARGHFTIDSLAPGTYELRAHTDWDRETDVQHGPSVTVAVGATAHAKVVFAPPTGELTGSVVDSRGGPVTDAYVSAALEDGSGDGGYHARGSWHRPAVLTDLDGNFRITGLPRGKFAVRAERQGGVFAIAEHVELGGRARVALPATGAISGVVSGKLVDDVTVSAQDQTREISREERLYHTGGRFTLRELPGGTYRLAVDDDPHSMIEVTLAEGEQREVQLVAQPRFTVRGRLVAAGRAVQGWTVQADRLEREIRSEGRHVVVSSVETAVTGADGRFLLRNMPAGPLELQAADLSSDPSAKLAVVAKVTLQSTADVDVGDVEVKP